MIAVRSLTADEWERFRTVRLYALLTEKDVFRRRYADEEQLDPETWRRTIGGPDHQVFGLFDGDRLIGITGVFRWQEDPSGKSAVLAMSYIVPWYRRRGFSRLLYEARLRWIETQSSFERIVVSHRAGNEASRRANQAQGFVLTGEREVTWPDGSRGRELLYEKRLPRRDPGVT